MIMFANWCRRNPGQCPAPLTELRSPGLLNGWQYSIVLPATNLPRPSSAPGVGKPDTIPSPRGAEALCDLLKMDREAPPIAREYVGSSSSPPAVFNTLARTL